METKESTTPAQSGNPGLLHADEIIVSVLETDADSVRIKLWPDAAAVRSRLSVLEMAMGADTYSIRRYVCGRALYCAVALDEQYKNNNTRENNTRAGARESVRDVLRESFPWNERLTEALLAFEESRAAGKHPLTVNAASLACNKLNQLADEAGVRDRYGYMAAVLEQSILRGWEGLFALKDDFVDAVPTQRPASTEDRPREIGPDTDILDFL